MNVFSRRGDREPQPNWMNWNAGEGRNGVLIFAEKCGVKKICAEICAEDMLSEG